MIEKGEIRINNQNYVIAQNFGAIMLFETLAKKKYTDIDNSISDMMLYFYSVVKYNNKNFVFSFEDFVSLIDSEPESFTTFAKFIVSEIESPKNTKKKTP